MSAFCFFFCESWTGSFNLKMQRSMSDCAEPKPFSVEPKTIDSQPEPKRFVSERWISFHNLTLFS